MGRGKDWETRLSSLLKKIPNHTLTATEAPTVIVKGRMVYKSKGMLDFEGGFRGIHLAMDAKEIAEPRLNFKSKIKDHQIQRMKETTVTGGASALLVRFAGFDGADYGLPAIELLRMLTVGHKSIKHDEMVDNGAMLIRDLGEMEAFLDTMVRRAEGAIVDRHRKGV